MDPIVWGGGGKAFYVECSEVINSFVKFSALATRICAPVFNCARDGFNLWANCSSVNYYMIYKTKLLTGTQTQSRAEVRSDLRRSCRHSRCRSHNATVQECIYYKKEQ